MKLFTKALCILATASAVYGDKCVDPLDPSADLSSEHDNNRFLQWLDKDEAKVYKHREYVSSNPGACIGASFMWTIEDEKIKVAVAVKATGWLGLGWSEAGGMRGLDLMVYEWDKDKLTDMWVGDGYIAPTPDPDDRQDWSLVGARKTDDGYLIVRAERDLDTHDDVHDRPVVDDSDPGYPNPPILIAWGDTSEMMYHSQNRAQRTLQLFIPEGEDAPYVNIDSFYADMAERADGVMTLAMSHYQIPTKLTTYKQNCFSLNYLQSQGVLTDEHPEAWVIGYELVIPDDFRPYLHHMIVYGHEATTNPSPNICGMRPSIMTATNDGISDNFLVYPTGPSYGFKMGRTGRDFMSISLDYHVNNFDGNPNLDFFGNEVKIYYQNKKTDHELGMFISGDPAFRFYHQPVGNGKVVHEFTCPGALADPYMELNEVTVVSEAFHMHNTGKRMTNRITRNGEIINSAENDFFDFEVSSGSTRARQNPYVIRKGDVVHTKCYFEGTGRVFGEGSDDEMCTLYITYYPRQNIPNCNTGINGGTHTTRVLPADSDFNRIFGSDVTNEALDDDGTVVYNKNADRGEYDEYEHHTFNNYRAAPDAVDVFEVPEGVGVPIEDVPPAEFVPQVEEVVPVPVDIVIAESVPVSEPVSVPAPAPVEEEHVYIPVVPAPAPVVVASTEEEEGGLDYGEEVEFDLPPSAKWFTIVIMSTAFCLVFYKLLESLGLVSCEVRIPTAYKDISTDEEKELESKPLESEFVIE